MFSHSFLPPKPKQTFTFLPVPIPPHNIAGKIHFRPKKTKNKKRILKRPENYLRAPFKD
jgi:hypothetical protein